MPTPRKIIPPDILLEAYQRNAGNKRATARELGVDKDTVRYSLSLYGADKKPLVGGDVKPLRHNILPLPEKGKVKRYILSSAQNNTKVFTPFLKNLEAYRLWHEENNGHGEIQIARFSYNKNQFLNEKSQKPGTIKPSDEDQCWYDNAIEPYICDDPERHGTCRWQLAPDLFWCSEMNILPTAAKPLSDLKTYTGTASSIFPHAKVAMCPVPTLLSPLTPYTKHIYTTGVLTGRNYVKKKAGLKAEFHHCFHPDTPVVTKNGPYALRDLKGKTVDLWTGEKWISSEIRSFGRQQLNNIKLKSVFTGHFGKGIVCNSLNTYDIKATADHEWIKVDGTRTRELKIGDRLKGAVYQPNRLSSEYLDGVRHGLVFGDGTICYKSIDDTWSFQLPLHGEKADRWRNLFDNHKVWPSRQKHENYTSTAYCKSKDNLKQLPFNKGNDYVAGFIQGWLDADGIVTNSGTMEISSIDKFALEWAQKVCASAGLFPTSLREAGPGSYPNCQQMYVAGFTDKPRDWQVTSIELDDISEVMCAVVPEEHKFTLGQGILTGNCFAALLVEVNDKGDWWCRQLSADSKGDFYDCPGGHVVKVSKGVVSTEGHRLEALNWGDVHVTDLPYERLSRYWGQTGKSVIDLLNPRYQFFHDTLSFRSRTHHEMKSFSKMLEKHVNGMESVEEELKRTISFLSVSERKDTLSVVVRSNHDAHGEVWLDSADYKSDFPNVEVFLEAQLDRVRAIKRGEASDWMFLEWAARKYGAPETVRFLKVDESFVICQKSGHPIECSLHGDIGPNGSRGSTMNLSTLGCKTNKGHDHSATILEGVCSAGTCAEKQGYNHGATTWSISHIGTYVNGKRQILTERAKQLWAA